MSKKFSIKDMVLCALFAAVCCVCSVISIPNPLSTVPFTLATFGIMVTAMILGTKRGLIAVVVFILLGVVGLPVFSEVGGGIAKIAGPTGGYIYSYILMVPAVGVVSKSLNKTLSSGMFTMLGCLAAILICYFVGTVHFMIVMSVAGNPMGIWAALCACVFPFIPFDILKAVIAIIVAPRLKPVCK